MDEPAITATTDGWSSILKERERERHQRQEMPVRSARLTREEREREASAYNPVKGRFVESARERRTQGVEKKLQEEQMHRKESTMPSGLPYDILTGHPSPGVDPASLEDPRATRGPSSVRRRANEMRSSDIFNNDYKCPPPPHQADPDGPRARERRPYDILAQQGQEKYISPRMREKQEQWKAHHSERYDVLGARWVNEEVEVKHRHDEVLARQQLVQSKKQMLPKVYRDAPGNVYDVVGHHIKDAEGHKSVEAEKSRQDAIRAARKFDERAFAKQCQDAEQKKDAAHMARMDPQRYRGHGYDVLSNEAKSDKPTAAREQKRALWDKINDES